MELKSPNPALWFIDNTSANKAWSIYNQGSDDGLAFRSQNDDGSGLLTRLFLKHSNGYVGIGTTSPAAGLDVQAGGTYSIQAGGRRIGGVGTPSEGDDAVTRDYVDTNFAPLTGAGYWELGGNVLTAKEYFGSTTDYGIGFKTNDLERMTITNTGNIGIGTDNPGSLLTIANDNWISAVNSDGTGYVNMFKVNTNNQLELGTAINAGTFEFAPDSGFNTFVDMAVTSAPAVGTVEGYSMKIDGNNILSLYSEANGSGGIQNEAVGIGTSSPSSKLTLADGDFEMTNNKSIKIQDANNNTTLLIGNYADGGGFSYGSNYTASLAVEGDVKGNRICIEEDCKATWSGIVSGGMPVGTSGQTLRHNGSDWLASSMIYNDGSNVGIGTATPTTELDVYGNTSSQIYYDRDNTNYYLDPAANVMSHSAIFAGNVGIGTTSPNARLNVQGNSSGDETPLIIQKGQAWGTDGDDLGISFVQYLGGAAARIAAERINAVDYSLNFYTSTDGSTFDKQMTIDDNGNVGIGTTNPIYKLQLAQSADSNGIEVYGYDDKFSSHVGLNVNSGGVGVISGTQDIKLQAGGGGYVFLDSEDNVYYDVGSSSYDHIFRDGAGTTLAVIKGTGNVGIGTTGPASKLHVIGAAKMSNSDGSYRVPLTDTELVPKRYVDDNFAPITGGVGSAFVQGGNSFGDTATLGTNDNYNLAFETNGSTKMTIDSGGNVGIGAVSPEQKLTIVSNSGPAIRMSTGITNHGFYLGSADSNEGILSFGADFTQSGGAVNSWIAKETSTGIIRVDNGELNYYTNTGLTPGNTFTPISRFTILGNGNVGIGTTNPSNLLTLYSSGNSNLRITNDTTNYVNSGMIEMLENDGVWGSNTHGFRFHHDGNANKLHLQSTSNVLVNEVLTAVRDSGYVGLNNTSPTYRLDVSGNARFTNTVTVATPTSGPHAATKDYVDSALTAGDSDWAGVGGAPTLGGEIYHTGNVGIGTNNPSEKLHVKGGDIKIESPDGSGPAALYIQDTRAPYVGEISQRSDGRISITPRIGDYTMGIEIMNSGQVGIGTTNPGSKLDVRGTSRLYSDSLNDYALQIYSGDTGGNRGGFYIDNGDSLNLYMSNNASTPIRLNTNGISYLNGGNIGIGSSSPTYRLDVSGNARFTNTVTVATPTSGPHAATKDYVDSALTAGDSDWAGVGGAPTLNGSIYHSGSVGIGTSNPSAKLHVEGGQVRLRGTSGAFIGDTFTADTQQTYISFLSAPGSNDPGYIMHETSGTETNEGIIHLAPSDDNAYGDYVSIHGTNDSDSLKLHSSGDIEGVTSIGNDRYNQRIEFDGVNNEILMLGSNVGINDISPSYRLDVNGNARFVQTVSVATPIAGSHATTKDYVDGALTSGTYWSANGNDIYNSNSGNVGIGISNPRGKLEIYNTSVTSDGDRSSTETVSGQDSILLYGHGGTLEDTYGSITWMGGSRRRAMITAVAENADSDHIGLAFYTQGTDGSGDMFESMRITRNGNIGIGTHDPGYNFQVQGSGYFNNTLTVGTPTAGSHATTKSYVDSAASSGGQWTDAGSYIYANNASNVVVEDGGNVGIGTNNPGDKLEVSGHMKLSGGSTLNYYAEPTSSTYEQSLRFFDDMMAYTWGGGIKTYFNNSGIMFGDYGAGSGTNSFTKDAAIISTLSGTANNYRELRFRTGGAYRMHIDEGGNVGIGMTSPSSKLDVQENDSSSPALIIRDETTNSNVNIPPIYFSHGGDRVRAAMQAVNDGPYGDKAIAFFSYDSTAWTNTSDKLTEHMRITSSGNLGVGTTVPSYKLQVNGTGYFSNNVTVATPVSGSHAVTKDYVDGALTSGTYWSPNGNDIYNSNSGNIGIGTTNPTSKLDVIGQVSGSDPVSDRNFVTKGWLNNSWNGRYYEYNFSYYHANTPEYIGTVTISNNGSSGYFSFDYYVKNKENMVSGIVHVSSVNEVATPSVKVVGADVNGGVILASRRTDQKVIDFYYQSPISIGYSPVFRVYDTYRYSNDEPSLPSSWDYSFDLNKLEANNLIIYNSVGINDETPSYKLDVNGTARFTGTVSVATPTADSHAVTRSYLDSAISPITGGAYWELGGNSLSAKGYIGSTNNYDIGFKTNDVERMTITNDGNVGIGASSPNANLEIQGEGIIVENSNSASYGAGLKFKNNSYAHYTVGSKGSNFVISETSSGGSSVWDDVETDISDRFIIDTVGNVGINTTDPSYKLDVNGAGRFTNTVSVSTPTSGSHATTKDYVDGALTSGTYWSANGNDIYNNNTENVGIGTNTPNAKLQVNPSSGTYAIFVSSGADYGIRAYGSTMGGRFQDSDGTSTTYAAYGDWGIYTGQKGYFGGNVGIGTTSPAYKLDVNGTGNFSNTVTVATPVSGSHAVTKDYVDGALTSGTFWAANGDDIYNSNSGNVGIGIGTTAPGSLLTIANDNWVTAVNSDGTGYVNMFKVNSNNQLELGTAINAGTFEFAPDSGFNTFVDMAVTSAPAVGTVEGYSMKIDGNNILSLYSEADGSGGIQNEAVGIGTSNPVSELEVVGTITASSFSGPLSGTINAGNVSSGEFASNTGGGFFSFPSRVGIGTTSPVENFEIYSNGSDVAQLIHEDAGTHVAKLRLRRGTGDAELSLGGILSLETKDGQSIKLQSNLANNALYMQGSSGNIGIGTGSPTAKLHVVGNTIISGTLSTQTGSDFAEEFVVSDYIEPGTVVVMGDLGYKSVKASSDAFDSSVVGVVSDNPSIIAGKVDSEKKAIVAMVGVVSVKVVDEGGEIKRGDLLTSSSVSGYARKADEYVGGTIIGKALEDLQGEKGMIKVLVNLQ
jgi:hypothetical protein